MPRAETAALAAVFALAAAVPLAAAADAAGLSLRPGAVQGGPVTVERFLDRLAALKRAPALPALAGWDAAVAGDLSRIAAEALFPGATAIVLFTGPDCPDCDAAAAELSDLAGRLGVAIRVLNIEEARHGASLQRLGLDSVPSYAMPDRMIRGRMPAIVLERYLTE